MAVAAEPSTRRRELRGGGWVMAGGNDATILSPTRGKAKAAEEPEEVLTHARGGRKRRDKKETEEEGARGCGDARL